MKKNIALLLSAFAIALTFSSCAPRIPFTQDIRLKEQLNDDEIKKIQFYASHDIVLQRGEKGGKEKAIEQGTLTTKAEKSVDQVIIKRGTPGIVDKVIDSSRVAVRFEDGEEKYLVFGDPNHKGRYTLLAAEWDNNNRGKLHYDGKIYYTLSGAANVYLTFRMKNILQFKKNQKIVKGMKL